MAKVYRVYKITNTVDDKIYIGSTKRTLVERFKEHLYDATCNATIKLYINIRDLGFEKFNIELVKEEFTQYPKYFEQIEMNKNDKSILLNTIAADANAKVKITKYHQKINNIIRLIKQKIDEHNSVSDDHWDVNLINFNTSEWVLNKFLSKIDEGIFTELFKEGRLSFY